jgi:hypothetical protein
MSLSDSRRAISASECIGDLAVFEGSLGYIGVLGTDLRSLRRAEPDFLVVAELGIHPSPPKCWSPAHPAG